MDTSTPDRDVTKPFMRPNYRAKGDGAPEAETLEGLNLKTGFWSQKVF